MFRAASTLRKAFLLPPPKLPRAIILALASTFPPIQHRQEDFLERFLSVHKLSDADIDFVTRVFTATTIQTCSSFLPKERLFEKMTREEYVAYIKPSLLQLARDASTAALKQWGGEWSAITHIIFCTMTGSITAPTLDTQLCRELGLRGDIKRVNIENMGCLGGFKSLALANELAVAKPENIVLVVVCDIRSALGNQLTPHVDYEPVDRANVIASCLFRDSGGACIVAHPVAASKTSPPLTLPGEEGPLYEILDTRSMLVPGSEHLAVMQEKDGGCIHLFIHKELPDVIKKELPALIFELLEPHDISPEDCCYAVHTGGPRVIKNTAAALGVEAELMGASWHVMHKYGNLSGSSNLVVLDHVRRLAAEGAPGVEEREYCIGISFGPGVGIETVLLRKLGWGRDDSAKSGYSRTSLPSLPRLTEEEDE